MKLDDEQILEFLVESNAIEGIDIPLGIMTNYWEDIHSKGFGVSGRHARNSCDAMRAAIGMAKVPLTTEIVLALHATQMMNSLPACDTGAYRRCNVAVGGDLCPDPKKIPPNDAPFSEYL